MPPSESPFSRNHPSLLGSALAYAVAVVNGKPISHAMIDALPHGSSLQKNRNYEDSSITCLARTKWLNNDTLKLFVKLLPSNSSCCIVLPVNWVVGEKCVNPAEVLLSIGQAPPDSDLVVDLCDMAPDQVLPRSLAKRIEDQSRDFQQCMGHCFDSERKCLNVQDGQSIACLCFDEVNHFRLMVVAVGAAHADLCFWDPLDILAAKAPDAQVRTAQVVMQKLLPERKVQIVRATSLKVLQLLEPFQAGQQDGYQCGPFSVRALSQLVYGKDMCFSLDQDSLRRVRVWMAASLAQGKLCL